LAELPIDVKLCPGVLDPPLHIGTLAREFGVPVLPLLERPLKGWRYPLKRAEDILVSTALLVFVAPLMLLVALLVKLDSPGPMLFRQLRHGFNNRPIVVYKFRTMHASAAGGPVIQASRGDARVTRLGRFLRASSIDELPQLFNVLKGDMSLVGPRPHALAHNEHYGKLIDLYFARHRMKPGITGWAQVHGLRGETDRIEKMERRLQHDLHYVENWTLLFDLKILAMTVWAVLSRANAY
jgi:putative colanic acid biosynthesis UDP-glucose lipid carrier transferase